MWNLKYGTNEPTYKTETDPQIWRTDLRLTKGRGGGEGWTGSLGLVNANYYTQNGYTQNYYTQQGPTTQLKEVYSVYCDKP